MTQLDQDYVFLPQRLIADLQANPAAIGVYALIARLFLIYQAPIPLSAADLQRYDPTLSYGAARGALQRLTALRWLTDQSGHKNQYTPTWGMIKATTQPWRMDAPTLGRPAHVITLRLDRRLLDVGMGKLIPHPTYPAQTNDRYLEQPILSLRDVGAYAQVLNGQALVATPALWRYGLIRDGLAQPLPAAAEMIALASQRTLDGDGAAPTEQGLRTLGLDLSSTPPALPPGQPLFFVDHALIPDPISCLILDLIPAGMESEHPSSAAEWASSDADVEQPRMAGTPGILSEKSESPPHPPIRRQRGGGGDHHAKKEIDRGAAQPETESARLLRAINAFPSSIAELAAIPAELVGRAIAYAESEPGIESIPGWVIEALRRNRDEGWPIPAPRARQLGLTGRDRPIDIEHYTSGAYGDLFRRGSDTSGLEDCFIEREEGTFVSPSGDTLEQAPEKAHGQGEPFIDMGSAIAEAQSPADCSPPESADAALTREVQAELRMRCGRQRGRVIEGLRVHVAGGTTLIICAMFADLDIAQRELIGALQHILARLGVPPQLVFTTRAGWDARKSDAGNASSRPDGRQGVVSPM
jgi:hypothetical protein